LLFFEQKTAQEAPFYDNVTVLSWD